MADLIERYKITANLPSVLMNYCNRFNSKQLESITEMIYELENSIESADVQPVNQWISVKDRLPEIIYNSSENVLIYLKNGEQYVAMYVGKDKDFGIEAYWSTSDMHRDFECDKVTHWQPLPEAPKYGGAENEPE